MNDIYSFSSIKKSDVERCMIEVDLAEVEIMKSPCCCFFLDKRNTMEIEKIIDGLKELPEELNIIEIPIYPSPASTNNFSLDGIENIVFNLFRKIDIKQIEETNTAFLKVYFEKDPLFTIPMIKIEVIFFNELKLLNELRNVLRNEIIALTGSIGEIKKIKVISIEDVIRALQIPLLIGQDMFVNEGAFKKHNFTSNQITELNNLYTIPVIELEINEILSNIDVNLFNQHRRENEEIEEENTKKADPDFITSLFNNKSDELPF